MQIDLLPELQQSGGYKFIINAIDVISRHAFASPVSNPTAMLNTPEVIIDTKTRHAYLPTLMTTHKGSIFVSNVIQEKAEILSITLCHATSKHAQTIGALERTPAAIKTSVKLSSGEIRNQWHKYSPIAIGTTTQSMTRVSDANLAKSLTEKPIKHTQSQTRVETQNWFSPEYRFSKRTTEKNTNFVQNQQKSNSVIHQIQIL